MFDQAYNRVVHLYLCWVWGQSMMTWKHFPHNYPFVHDDVIKWKHFPRYWPFVRGIHRSPVNSLHKGQWRGALVFSLICDRINGWVNNREAGDLRRYRAHYDVIVMVEVWDEITWPFPNFSGATVKIWEWISSFIPHFCNACNYVSML